MKNLLRIFILLTCFVGQAHAAVIASLTGSYDRSKPVHLLVTGYAHGMGLQFVESAVAAARRYHDLYPDHEVIILRNNETGTISDAKEMEALGLKVISQGSAKETGEFVVKVAGNFTAIASLEFFSHSSIHAGAGLEGDIYRFNIATENIANLKGKFLPEGYIFFHGCNTGFFQAPEMSKLLGVPVFGALTSTDFHHLSVDGDWPLYDPHQFPASTWASVNTLSYAQPISCALGACLRMAPDNAPYDGVWGHYQGGGLPFYKMFCNNGISELECAKVMATALLSWPSKVALTKESSDADIIEAATDFLCPSDRKHHQNCVDALEKSLAPGASEIYSSFEGNTIACNYQTCNVSWTCQYDPNGNAIQGSCAVSAPVNHQPKTMVQEFKRYLLGFRELNH